MKISGETSNAIVEWCRYHYQDNLLGVALFDPTPVDSGYPHGDINVLIVLAQAPSEARDRYDALAMASLESVTPDHSLTCRIQTADELEALIELKMPIVAIYLTATEVLHDPRGVLQQLRDALNAPH